MKLLTVNVSRPRIVEYTDSPGGLTGIDKQPVDGAVRVTCPGPERPEGEGGSGLAGDTIADLRQHGGTHQAVYAFAREDLDHWGRELDSSLPNGAFGENLTTIGIDVNGALIGERWRIGDRLVLEITSGRIPCRTFAGWLGENGWASEKGWVKRFTRTARSGAYLRVVEPGEIRAGDAIGIVHRPAHDVTVELAFRAATAERSLLPRVLAAGDALHPELRGKAHVYMRKHGATGSADYV
ncbi:MOSC domain-containing protein [Streptomyces sp. NPDC020965]|uniref:MOSC domain-containing protein n=1 Tax=Streptomyces sp. NPDC020965 TaxID=3365105 RepID=UPI0037A04021